VLIEYMEMGASWMGVVVARVSPKLADDICGDAGRHTRPFVKQGGEACINHRDKPLTEESSSRNLSRYAFAHARYQYRGY
jgi:hypothetical protein